MAQEYVPPSEIDGSPAEVERAVIKQIVVLFEEAVVQIRNAYMTRLLDAEPGLTPEQLADLWSQSDRRAQCERVHILLERL